MCDKSIRWSNSCFFCIGFQSIPIIEQQKNPTCTGTSARGRAYFGTFRALHRPPAEIVSETGPSRTKALSMYADVCCVSSATTASVRCYLLLFVVVGGNGCGGGDVDDAVCVFTLYPLRSGCSSTRIPYIVLYFCVNGPCFFAVIRHNVTTCCRYTTR